MNQQVSNVQNCWLMCFLGVKSYPMHWDSHNPLQKVAGVAQIIQRAWLFIETSWKPWWLGDPPFFGLMVQVHLCPEWGQCLGDGYRCSVKRWKPKDPHRKWMKMDEHCIIRWTCPTVVRWNSLATEKNMRLPMAPCCIVRFAVKYVVFPFSGRIWFQSETAVELLVSV